MTWVDPFGLVLLAGLVEGAGARGEKVEFRAPQRIDLARYLARMRFSEVLDAAGVEHFLPPVTEHDVGDRLLELSQFGQDDDSIEDLAAKIHSIFFHEDPDEAKALFQGVAEAAANVCDHSGRPVGWAAMQQYKYGATTHVAFAVADSGKGLRAALSAVYDVSDDRHAVRLAFERGVTGTGQKNRGLGLHRIVESALSREGSVRLWSDTATGMTTPGTGKIFVRDSPVGYPGTIAHASLRCS